MLLMMLVAYLPWLLFGGGLLYLGVRAVRALERRSTASAEFTALRERVEMLEETVSTQAEAMRRVEEGQRFTDRLLAERSGDALRPGDDRATVQRSVAADEDARVAPDPQQVLRPRPRS